MPVLYFHLSTHVSFSWRIDLVCYRNKPNTVFEDVRGLLTSDALPWCSLCLCDYARLSMQIDRNSNIYHGIHGLCSSLLPEFLA
jgi:hypothetical protein